MTEKDNSGCIKVPGVEIHLPSTWAGSIALSMIVIGISVITIGVVVYAPKENLEVVKDVIGGVQASTYYESGLANTEYRRQFQFMTPLDPASVYPEAQSGTTDSEIRQSKVEQFGIDLIKRGLTKGWRRYRYEGQGRNRDTGWWWTITVDGSFDIDKFVKFYLEYWDATEIYVEKFDTFGNLLPSGSIPIPNMGGK